MHFNVSASAEKFHLQLLQNLTIFHFFLYDEILSSKKYLANFGAAARFHSISITVESVEKVLHQYQKFTVSNFFTSKLKTDFKLSIKSFAVLGNPMLRAFFQKQGAKYREYGKVT